MPLCGEQDESLVVGYSRVVFLFFLLSPYAPFSLFDSLFAVLRSLYKFDISFTSAPGFFVLMRLSPARLNTVCDCLNQNISWLGTVITSHLTIVHNDTISTV